MKGGASGAPPTGGQGLRAEPHTADVDGPVLRGLTGHRGSPTRFTGDPRHLQENHVNKGVFRGAEKAFDKIRLIHFQNSRQARSERRGPGRGCGIHEEPAGCRVWRCKRGHVPPTPGGAPARTSTRPARTGGYGQRNEAQRRLERHRRRAGGSKTRVRPQATGFCAWEILSDRRENRQDWRVDPARLGESGTQ